MHGQLSLIQLHRVLQSEQQIDSQLPIEKVARQLTNKLKNAYPTKKLLWSKVVYPATLYVIMSLSLVRSPAWELYFSPNISLYMVRQISYIVLDSQVELTAIRLSVFFLTLRDKQHNITLNPSVATISKITLN